METFNLIITGVGGQGIVTLVSILDEACLIEGYDVKSSELHGLSQRGGSIITHVRFGKKVYSPMVLRGSADLIISSELLETLRDAEFTGPKTIFLVNNHKVGFEGYLPEAKITEFLNKITKHNLHLVMASEVCKKELGRDVLAGVYLLGYAVYKKLIPLQPESVLKAIEAVVPEKYKDINIKAFNLAKKA
ncbi:MAG: indolepyruvate oxidoreductase subunit beta [Candidatus Staskawiczbacteria bacterium]|nr:indolepyruvate oxidoreductase subunit beta [Candidatus Staskawiczbacteria bacterium]